MRITNQLTTENAIRHMNQNLETLQQLQEQISSGKTIQNISDDPAAASTVLSMHSTLATVQSYMDAANVADDWMSATEASLSQLTNMGTRANTLSTSGVSGTMGANERISLANELDEVLKQAIQAANTSHEDKYIFGGFQVRPPNPPFQGVDTNADGRFDTVAYTGDNGVIQREIGPGTLVTTNVNGNAAFQPMFQAMIAARDALFNNNTTTLKTAITNLNSAMQTLSAARTGNGGRQRQLEAAITRITTSQTEIKNLLSKKEDTNMAEAISHLTNQQTIYQATLEVGQRAIAMATLFDYLK
jgi:flagellar hook-associated protein 3 FlgL